MKGFIVTFVGEKDWNILCVQVEALSFCKAIDQGWLLFYEAKHDHAKVDKIVVERA